MYGCRPMRNLLTVRCGRLTNQALLVGAEYGIRVASTRVVILERNEESRAQAKPVS